MPVGVQLSELRRLLRAEVGQSLNPSQGVNAQGQYDLALARQQQELWEAYDWVHLTYYVDVPLSSGQELYDYPDNVTFEAIQKAWAQNGTKFDEVSYGIDMHDINSNLSPSWPPKKWANSVKITSGKVVPAGQFRVLPTPSQDGTLRFVGQAACNPLIADTDICVLDSTLITLFAAAEILATQKSEAGPLKLQKAQQYLRRLLANQSSDKSATMVLSGAQIAAAHMRPDNWPDRRFRTPTE